MRARSGIRSLILLLSAMLACNAAAMSTFDDALEISQAAIGSRLPDLAFVDTQGVTRRLSEFEGRPVLVSLIFSACVHSCSVATRHIDRAVRVARHALGQDSFVVLTIGFDHPVDSPQAMHAYARRHAINDPNWHFLSSPDAETVAALTSTLGFSYVESPRGFDHTVQLTVIGQDGVVRRQIYGETFNMPLLVEPLKHFVLGTPAPDAGVFERVGNRIRLICTVYDPKADRYYFDYSLFVGMFISTIVLGSVLIWLVAERRRRVSRRDSVGGRWAHR
jgi:protein SCO1